MPEALSGWVSGHFGQRLSGSPGHPQSFELNDQFPWKRERAKYWYIMYPASNTSDDQPRTRTARACDSCYKRKVGFVLDQLSTSLNWSQIKCDAALPQCNWCSHHNISCTFDRVVQRKRKNVNDEGWACTSSLFFRVSDVWKTPQSFTAIGAN